MTNPWERNYEKLDDIVSKSDEFSARISAALTPNSAIRIRQELEPYSEAKNAHLVFQASVESRTESSEPVIHGETPFEDKFRIISALEKKFDRQIEKVESSVLKRFKKEYKTRLKDKTPAVMENKKRNLFELCNEYSRLDLILPFNVEHRSPTPKNRFTDERIAKFASFYRGAQKIDERINDIAKRYIEQPATDELRIMLNDARQAASDYKRLVKNNRPMIRRRDNPYNCDAGIERASRLAEKIEGAIIVAENSSDKLAEVKRKLAFNSSYASKLSAHLSDENPAQYFSRDELESGRKAKIIPASPYGGEMKEAVSAHNASVKAVEAAKSAAKEYITTELDALSKREDTATLGEAYKAFTARQKEILRLGALEDVIGEKSPYLVHTAESIDAEGAALETIKAKADGITQDIERVQRGLFSGLTEFRYAHEKKTPYLRELVEEYEGIFKKASEAKANSASNNSRAEQASAGRRYPVQTEERSAHLPLVIDCMGLPRNDTYYKLRDVLLGEDDRRADQSWSARFERLGRTVSGIPLARDEADLDYLRRLQDHVEYCASRGAIQRDAAKNRENARKIDLGLCALQNYITRSEEKLMTQERAAPIQMSA